ncbi:hypothetical protein BT69DRAFT_330216 [Atractiella rhizophila]|nr:hypothetical protein BT69DRAFT_330216 [Atractiella rhizophila]
MLPLLFATLLGGTTAQKSDAVCGQGFSWMNNDLGQSPCQVAATIFAFCQGSSFTLWALPGPNWAYPGPTSQAVGDHGWNRCDCSMPVYNLLSACADCQGSRWVTYAQHTQQCNSSYTGDDQGAVYFLPIKLPDTTTLPSWADHNSTQNNGGIWDEGVSRQIADSAGSTTTTTGSSATGTNQSSNGGGGGGSSNAGAIAGGVVGGVAALAIAIGGFWWYRRRQRNAAPAGAAKVDSGSPGSDDPFTTPGVAMEQHGANLGPSPVHSPQYPGFVSNPFHPNHPEMRQFHNATASTEPVSSERGSRVVVPEIQGEDLNRPDEYDVFRR